MAKNNIRENQTLKKIQSEINENEIISKLSQEYDIDDLLEFNEFTVNEKLQNNAYLLEQFRMMYIHEKQKYNKLEAKFNEKAGETYNYYKYEDSRDLSKVEIERYYLPTDKELIRLKKLLQLQETRVEFFEALMESFKSQGFNMRNFIENLKIGG